MEENSIEEKNNRLKISRASFITAVTVAVFLCVLVLVILYVTGVLRKKWTYSENAAQLVVEGYYEEPANSLDVLFVGASTIRNGISPLELFQDFGITSYCRATSVQIPIISYHLLRETLETQDLKAVVMDATGVTSALYDDLDGLGAKIHEAVDYMPSSSIKDDLINDVVAEYDDLTADEFKIPLYAYHDRWTELTEEDFAPKEENYYYKGQFPALRSRSTTYSEDYMKVDGEEENYYILESQAEYVVKMKQLCDEKGIPLILLKTPVASWSLFRHNLVWDFANEYDIPFLDLNLLDVQQDMQFDEKKDYCDVGMHPNISGAQKITKYLGDYLSSNYKFENKRENNDYSNWDQALEKYHKILYDYALSEETNLVTFLNNMKGQDYLVLISSRNDTSKYFNQDLADAFGEFGVSMPFASYPFLSYLAVIDNDELIYEDSSLIDGEVSADPISHDFIYNNHTITMESHAARMTGNLSRISIDGTALSPNGNGFNFVVYDKELGQVIARRYFNTGLNGNEYNRVSELDQYKSDPLTYLSMLNDNEQYLSVLSVSGDSRKFLPGGVSKVLTEDLGLKDLPDGFNRPYIAVLDGSTVSYNETSDNQYSVLSRELSAHGLSISVISNCSSSAGSSHIAINDQTADYTADGLTVMVYNKDSMRLESKVHFNWSKNYTSEVRFANLKDLNYLISSADKYGYQVYCLSYDNGEEYNIDTVTILEKYGFISDPDSQVYFGVRADGTIIHEGSGADPLAETFTVNGNEISVQISGSRTRWSSNKAVYSITKSSGFYIIVYDQENDAVLHARRWK